MINYFEQKFSPPTVQSETIKESERRVKEKISRLRGSKHDVTLNRCKIINYIMQLKLNCAPANDGITAEHLRHGVGSPLIDVITSLLTICLKFGVVPSIFRTGVLVPILKKSGCDAAVPKNWRPVVISPTLSKLLEVYILDAVSGHEFDELQFGFVKGRGTDMATTLLRDVISYSTNRGSTVYTCSLDAEGAFDAIPHAILFDRASDVLPDHCWKIMYDWYCNLHVQIKWNGMLSRSIKVSIGTRQGGLTSPMLFNVFYQELVHLLSTCYSGITINNETYNVFCYADDIILASLSTAGLQQLIDTASSFIKAGGLNFNPSKTVCTIFGKHHLTTAPKWILNDTIFTEEKQVKYLGSILSNNHTDHVESRCKSARKAFYALQSAGLCKNGVDPYTIAHIYNVAIKPVLTYGCAAVGLFDKHVKELEKLQGSLIKTALGLSKFCRNTSLMRAMGISSVKQTIDMQYLSTLKNCITGSSKAKTFYLYLIHKHSHYNMGSHSSLLSRCIKVCDEYNTLFLQFMCIDTYARICKSKITALSPTNGLIDSISTLLSSFNDHTRQLVKLLIFPF